jgi:hypothetical protein
MRTNTTKAKLAAGQVVFGAIISRHAPDQVELFGAIAGIAEFIKLGANLVTISALGLLRLGADDFRRRVQAAL